MEISAFLHGCVSSLTMEENQCLCSALNIDLPEALQETFLYFFFIFFCLAWCRTSTAQTELEGNVSCSGLWIFVCPSSPLTLPLQPSRGQIWSDVGWSQHSFAVLSLLSPSPPFQFLEPFCWITYFAWPKLLSEAGSQTLAYFTLADYYWWKNTNSSTSHVCFSFIYGMIYPVALNSSVKQQKTATETSLLSVKQCSGLCFQVLDVCQHDPPRTASWTHTYKKNPL